MTYPGKPTASGHAWIWNGTRWLTQAPVTFGGDIAGTLTTQTVEAISPSSGAALLTGAIKIGASPPTTGSIRASAGTNIIYGRDTGATEVPILGVSNAAAASQYVTVGVNHNFSSRCTRLWLEGSTEVVIASGGTSTAKFKVAGTAITQSVATYTISEALGNMTDDIARRTGDSATNSRTFVGQQASATATLTNRNGGFLVFMGGERLNTNGKRGGVRVGVNGSAGDVLFEACDTNAEATAPTRVIALVRGQAMAAADMPTGDKVVYIGNAAVVPTTAPTNGGVFYSNAGVLSWMGPSGIVTELGAA